VSGALACSIVWESGLGIDAPANLNPDLRVILVGRTGLDAKLRLDPNVELVRVKSALDAVGEVAEPFETGPRIRTVVIVAPDAEPEPSIETEEDADYPVEFLRAVRSLNPDVKVLRLATGGAADNSDIYDGAVRPDLSSEALRAMLRGTTTRPAGANGHTPTNGAAPVLTNGSHARPAAPAGSTPPTPPAAPTVAADAGAMLSSLAERAALSEHTGDETLVRLLLRGKDIVPAALAMIRRRLGDRPVGFTPGASVSAGVPVKWESHVYGVLTGEHAPESELIVHAGWLASWLRLRDQQAQLREAAFTDPCTGAYNRRYCDKFLAAAMNEARNERRPLTVLYFDLDNFKQYNDRYGHAAGDDILNQVVQLLKAGVRPSDRVCRVGGDEFVVIFHEPDGPRQPDSKPPSSVFQIARRFQEQILKSRFPKLGLDAPGNLTISGGLVTFPWDGNSPQELIDKADLLALESKRQGKNVITIGPGAMTQQAAEQRYDQR
jgi:diguanylate cyclase (GGDEF)-like protein